jgi:GSH-dependent disulfide-bond oxidoreductase
MPRTIDLYYWPTPNGKKVTIFLEEVGLPYNLMPVDITAAEQFDEEFLRISPNNKMPAIVDSEGPNGEPISVFESGAILLYLAEKTGRFMPSSPRQRYEALQWLMFQVSSVGPMLGQAHHFRGYAPEEIPYALDRYTNEAARLYGVMDTRLSEVEYFVDDDYSIVDMAIYPWVASHKKQGQKIEDFPNLRRWYEAMGKRPAVRRAMEVGEELRRPIEDLDEEARDVLFGGRRRTTGA